MINAMPYLALLPAAGLCYQHYATLRDEKNHPLPGDMVNVGGCNLHIQVTGKECPGMPIVIVETGIWDCSQSWDLVRSQLPEDIRLVTYDRAGYGRSDPGTCPRTFDRVVKELKALLEKKGIRPPFILVGHSLGGPIARYYQSQFPGDVAGMIFVDALHKEQPVFPRMFWPVSKAFSFLAHFGILRLMFKFCPQFSPNPQWTPTLQKTYIACHQAKASTLATCLDEWSGYEQSFKMLREKAKSLKDIPVALISRDPEQPIRPGMSKEAIKRAREELEKVHERQQEDSPHARFVIAKTSNHLVQLDRPDVIVEEIQRMIEEIGKKSKRNID
jgi:pimeloyl-ACP methyl ester carboxylesterase